MMLQLHFKMLLSVFQQLWLSKRCSCIGKNTAVAFVNYFEVTVDNDAAFTSISVAAVEKGNGVAVANIATVAINCAVVFNGTRVAVANDAAVTVAVTSVAPAQVANVASVAVDNVASVALILSMLL